MDAGIVEVARFSVAKIWKLSLMNKSINCEYDFFVVGGGPAGIAAAVRAAESGLRVGIADENPALGGQIWRRDIAGTHSEMEIWNQRLRGLPVTALLGVTVFDCLDGHRVLAESDDQVYEIRCDKLLIATGARELFLPFPGWTLPNVVGAAGLQALVKSGLPIERKRIVVAGTGPLLLAVAAFLRKHGAEVVLICEQTQWRRLFYFGFSLLRHASKLSQALSLRKDLLGVRFVANCWPVRARGNRTVEEVELSYRGKVEPVACEYLACGFGLVPNIELAVLMNCSLNNGNVRVDNFQETSVSGVFCAGEPTGIGGVDLSLIEGEIAGLAAAGRKQAATDLFDVRRKLQIFSGHLVQAFRLRRELKDLPAEDTIMCRCEDVMYSELRSYSSWRTAKLQMRCGMGTCQGRICGPALDFLFGWTQRSVRPPIFPVRLGSLALYEAPKTQKDMRGH